MEIAFVNNNEDFYKKSLKYGAYVRGYMEGVYIGDEKVPGVFPWQRKPAIIRWYGKDTIVMEQRIPEKNIPFLETLINPYSKRYEEFKGLLEKTESFLKKLNITWK